MQHSIKCSQHLLGKDLSFLGVHTGQMKVPVYLPSLINAYIALSQNHTITELSFKVHWDIYFYFFKNSIDYRCVRVQFSDRVPHLCTLLKCGWGMDGELL